MKTVTSIKIDKNTKEEAVALADKLGLTLSAIINASLKKFVRDKKITFDMEPELNKKSAGELRNALSEIRNSKELIGPFTKIADLKKSLLL